MMLTVLTKPLSAAEGGGVGGGSAVEDASDGVSGGTGTTDGLAEVVGSAEELAGVLVAGTDVEPAPVTVGLLTGVLTRVSAGTGAVTCAEQAASTRAAMTVAAARKIVK
jgi:hypothetical protein